MFECNNVLSACEAHCHLEHYVKTIERLRKRGPDMTSGSSPKYLTFRGKTVNNKNISMAQCKVKLTHSLEEGVSIFLHLAIDLQSLKSLTVALVV